MAVKSTNAYLRYKSMGRTAGGHNAATGMRRRSSQAAAGTARQAKVAAPTTARRSMAAARVASPTTAGRTAARQAKVASPTTARRASGMMSAGGSRKSLSQSAGRQNAAAGASLRKKPY